MTAEFTYHRRIQFAETDLAGVLHFSNYFRLMEETECAFWRSIGVPVYASDGDRIISWPRVATSCEYAAPARFEDELELVLTLEKIGERSVTHQVEVRRDNRRLALIKTTIVCCAMEHGRFSSVSIPAATRAKLEPYVRTDTENQKAKSS